MLTMLLKQKVENELQRLELNLKSLFTFTRHCTSRGSLLLNCESLLF